MLSIDYSWIPSYNLWCQYRRRSMFVRVKRVGPYQYLQDRPKPPRRQIRQTNRHRHPRATRHAHRLRLHRPTRALRRHSRLGYRSPVHFERSYQQAAWHPSDEPSTETGNSRYRRARSSESGRSVQPDDSADARSGSPLLRCPIRHGRHGRRGHVPGFLCRADHSVRRRQGG